MGACLTAATLSRNEVTYTILSLKRLKGQLLFLFSLFNGSYLVVTIVLLRSLLQ